MVRKTYSANVPRKTKTVKRRGNERESGGFATRPRFQEATLFPTLLVFIFAFCSLLMTERLGYNPAALSGDKEGTHGLARPL